MPVLALGVAIWGVLTQRMIARRKATMEHLAIDNTDGDMIKARTHFIELAKAEGGLAKWAEPAHERSEQLESIRLILNDFELVSNSIQFGIMDFEFYKQNSHGTVSRYWECAAPFIHALRAKTGRQSLYKEFEVLAGWIDKGVSPPKRSIWKRKLF